MNPRSLTFRLVAWYCALLVLVGAFFGIYTYGGFAGYLRGTMRDALATRANDAANLARPLLADPQSLAIAMERRFAPETHDRFMRLMLDGNTAYVSGPPIEPAFDPHTIGVDPSLTGSELQNVGNLWIYSRKDRLADGRSLIIQTGQLDEIMATSRRGLLDTLLIALPVLLIVAAFGGYWLVRRALAPVANMINAAEALTFNSPSKRLPSAGTGDVLDELGRTLNRMLERLDSAYQHVNRFSADVAHELRTPLTIMRSELEYLAGQQQLAPDAAASAESALDETIRLGQIIENLITLALIESAGGKRAHLAVDLRSLSVESIEQMQLLADEKRISTSCADGPPVFTLGDRGRLKQVLVNLVHNAIKYTEPGGRVSVDIRAEAELATLEVADSGIGIPQEHQHNVFERFYRVDPDRGASGAGLGLAIVRSICTAHGGSITLHSAPRGGSVFRVSLPLAPTQFPAADTAAADGG